MNFIKKMCVLRQIKQGFSGDGKSLTGLIKVEQYGENISVEVSVINFAPLLSGEYYCIIADHFDRTEILPLRGKSLFNILSPLNLSLGFCGIICFVKNDVVPIACGINGNKTYEFKKLLETLKEKLTPYKTAPTPPAPPSYEDEQIAENNYFLEAKYEQDSDSKSIPNAFAKTDGFETEENVQAIAKDEDAPRVEDGFARDSDGYYQSIKHEIDELFAKYPKDERLKKIFPYSNWVKICEEGKEYLVGVLFESLKAKYICYALPTQTDVPPDNLKEVCVFIPSSYFEETIGFFVIFQSTTTGECIHPEKM